MLLLALGVMLSHPPAPRSIEIPNEAMVGHYLVGLRELRKEVARDGDWGWADASEGSGCEVVLEDWTIVVTSKANRTCNTIALRSKVSIAALDFLIADIDAMDRDSPQTLRRAREAAKAMIGPLYPDLWSLLDSHTRREDLCLKKH